MNKNRNTYQNLWDVAKAVLRGKVLTHILKRSQINNLNFHLNTLGKQEQIKPKAIRRNEMIKITVEINKIENEKQQRKMNETKRWLLDNINKIDILLTRLTKKRREGSNY